MHFHFLTDTLNDFLLYLKGKTFYQAGATELLFFTKTFDLRSSLTVYNVHIRSEFF